MKHKTLKLLKKSLNYQTFLKHFPKKELSHKLIIYAEYFWGHGKIKV